METAVVFTLVVGALAARVWAGVAVQNFIEEQPAEFRERFRRSLARGV